MVRLRLRRFMMMTMAMKRRNRTYCKPESHEVGMVLSGLVMVSGQIEIGKTDGQGEHSLPANAKHGEIEWDF